MAMSSKIAITLPDEILKRIERSRRRNGGTRSAFIQRAVRLLFKQEQLQEQVRQYVEGYRRVPETDEEVAAAGKRAKAQLAQVPWE